MTTRPVRILQLITTTIGGAGEHVLTLSKGLNPKKFDVAVAFSPGMPLDQAFYNHGLRVVPVTMKRGGGVTSSARALWSLVSLMRRERFDIVHTHTSVAGAIGRIAARLARIPITIHMIHAYASHDHVPALKRHLLLAAERGLDRFTDFYIAGSEAIRTKGIGKKIMSPDKIRRIYYCLDLARHDEYQPSPGLRDELGLPKQGQIAGLVGRLEQQKGVEFFLEAARKIANRDPTTRFVVVGDGPLMGSLTTRSRRLGMEHRVHFLGWRKDIARVMGMLDLLVVPSLWEAFGIVILEAMAAGKPVVASRVEGIPEFVENGVHGRLVEPANVEELAEAISELLMDPERRARMGEAGRVMVRAEGKFGASRMIREHEQLYLERLSHIGAGLGET
jgi:glycosyltransferase involved in cell wall biosynthesis